MPNGQDRFADKARKRSPRKGRTIHIGKLGAASVEGAVTDVARELLPLMSSVSEGTWKRLGKWAVALARTEGITPDNDVNPELEQAIYADILFKGGILPNGNDSGWKPGKFIARPLSNHDRRERKAQQYYNLSDTIQHYEEFRDKLLETGSTARAADLEQRIKDLKSPAVQKQWDEFFEWYHQVECSIDGQRRAKLSPEEREAEDRKLELARQQIREKRNQRHVAAD